MLVRRIARPLLASTFVYGGIDSLRNPQSKVAGARPVVETITEQADKQLPVTVPRDVEQWVKADAAVKVAAGALLALGRLPRLSATLLAAVDTEGKPSVGYRARRAAHKAAESTEKTMAKAQKRAAKAQKKAAKRIKS